MISSATVVVPTRSDAVDAARALGAQGHAADLVADRRGAREGRHTARILAAEEVAILWAANADDDAPRDIVVEEPRGCCPDEWTHPQKALAWALLASDAYGTGTPGYWGASARVFPLNALGKGRRQAAGGAAWTAAIEIAAQGIACGALWRFTPVDGHLMVSAYGQEDVCCDALPLDAREAVAGTELLAAVDRRQRDEVAAWSAVYNAVRAEQIARFRELIRQDQLAAEIQEDRQ